MDFSKLKNKLLICLCCVVVILPFYLITFSFADFEDYTNVDYIDSINGIACNPSNTKFFTFNGVTTYVYDISNSDYVIINGNLGYIDFCLTYDYPSLGVSYFEPYKISMNGTYYIDLSEKSYNYFVVSTPADNIEFTVKTKSDGFNNSVNELVDVVGINSIWNIFDISINYIVVVILFAFGCYIIFKVIKKISKGKEGL